MTMRPTRRLLGIVVAAAIVYFGAMNSLLVWLYAVTAMLLALIPPGVIGPWLAVGRIRVIRSESLRSHGFDAPLAQDAGRIFAGDELEVRLDGSVRIDQVELGPLRTDIGAEIAAYVDLDGDTAVVRAALATRGQINIVSVDVASTWPFGLVEVRRRVPLAVRVLAHPRYSVVAAESGTGSGIGGEDPTRKGQADDVVGLREYHSGDSRRNIHWMTTARSGKLMVVERAAPTFAALQARLRLEPGASVDACDLAVFVTATLVASCTRAGRPFRLTLPDGPPESRRWNEAIARLARSRPGPSPPGRAVSAAIRADESGVTVESSGGVVRLLPGASREDVERIVAALL